MTATEERDEQLTDKEREMILVAPPLAFPGSHYVGKLLRLYDAANARAEAAEQWRDEFQSSYDQMTAALRADLVEAREVATRNATDCQHLRQSAIELRAEVERLRDVRTEHDWQFKKRQEAESRLVAANALLERLNTWNETEGSNDDLVSICADAAAHLAAQPATAPTPRLK